MIPKWLFILFLLSFMFGLRADEIIGAIDEGKQYYQNGEYSNALESLGYANQLIREKKGHNLRELLPEPLSGWEADPAISTAAEDALFGGGVSAERYYYKADSYVDISFICDSPLMESMMLMLSNPLFISADSGRIETISGQNAVVNYDPVDRSGDISVIVAEKYLVQVNGSRIDEQDLIDYTQAINFNGLEALK